MSASPNRNNGAGKPVEGSNRKLRSVEWPSLRRVRCIAIERSDAEILPGALHHRITKAVVIPNLRPCPPGPPAGNQIGHIDRRSTPKEGCLPPLTTVRRRLPDVTGTIVAVDHNEWIPIPLAARNLILDVGCLHSIVTVDRRIFKSAQRNGSSADKNVALTSDANGFPVIGGICGLDTLGRGGWQRRDNAGPGRKA